MLPKLGNSNLSEQTLALQQVLPLLKEYKVIVLGDREFCSVDLGNLPGTMGVSSGGVTNIARNLAAARLQL